jgi:hypothetical protein
MAILDIFIGAPQSKYAALAITVALLSVAVAMLVGKDSLPLGQKFIAILLMFFVALPGLLLSLFQLTCLVTGTGYGNKKWWCGAYAWIGTIIAFLYALVIVAIAVISITKGSSVEAELAVAGAEGFSDMKEAAEAARKMADKAAKEYFADAAPMPDMPAGDVPLKTEEEKKMEESMKRAAAEQSKMGAEGSVPAVAPEGTISTMPAEEVVIAEGFMTAPGVKKAAEGFYSYAQKTAEIAPSMPETFTSCGAPLAF